MSSSFRAAGTRSIVSLLALARSSKHRRPLRFFGTDLTGATTVSFNGTAVCVHRRLALATCGTLAEFSPAWSACGRRGSGRGSSTSIDPAIAAVTADTQRTSACPNRRGARPRLAAQKRPTPAARRRAAVPAEALAEFSLAWGERRGGLVLAAVARPSSIPPSPTRLPTRRAGSLREAPRNAPASSCARTPYASGTPPGGP